MTIKKLQNNFTTPDQSKRLLELGVPEWTADCVTSRYGGSTFFVQECQLLRRCIDSNNYVPCWSVGRLMEIFDICVIDGTGSWANYTTRLNYMNYLVACFETSKFDFSKLEK